MGQLKCYCLVPIIFNQSLYPTLETCEAILEVRDFHIYPALLRVLQGIDSSMNNTKVIS
jgi:hypothetical protein